MNMTTKTLAISLAASLAAAAAMADNVAAPTFMKEGQATITAEANALAEVLNDAPAAPAAEAQKGEEVQEAAPAAPAAAADVPDTGDEELTGVTVTSGDDPEKITVSLDAVELEDVVRLFTRLSGANIICNTTNLHGTVTANLADIGWKPALKAILRQQGLALIEDPLNPDVYEIGVPPPPGKEPLISKTFKLNYLKASEAATILRNFLGLDAGAKNQSVKQTVQKDKDGRVIEQVQAVANEQKGYVVAHPAANTVIVSCRGEEKMREVEKGIADLDIVRQQVYIEAKIVQLSGAASQKLGIDWGFLDGYTISAGNLSRVYQKTKLSTKKRGKSSEVNDSAEVRNERTSQSDSLYNRKNSSTHDVSSDRSSTGERTRDGYETDRETYTYLRDMDGNFVRDPSGQPAFDFNNSRYNHTDNKDYLSINSSSKDSSDRLSSLVREHNSQSSVLSSSSILSTIANSAGSSKDNSTEVADVRSAVFNADALSVMISALQTSDDVSQISNPKLIVANEERAVIDMTTKIPYVTIDMKQDGTGTESTYSYTTKMEKIPTPEGKDRDGKDIPIPGYIDGAFFSEGIRVDVTPRINNSSNITVVIEPMLSKVYDYYEPAGRNTGTRYPILNVRNVNTVFSLGDGQTAVIGGLTQTEDYDAVKKIPLLGDIPWIGKYLFSWSSKEKRQTEIIIFVTVGIVDPNNRETRMGLPEGARLVQKRIDDNGKIIDKRMRELETREERREADRKEAEKKSEAIKNDAKEQLEADIKEAEAKGLVVPEVVEE
jgi:type II secretory pathway component GspD/PulD (secretin)